MLKAIYYRLRNYFETEQGQQVITRFKSLAWRLGGMIVMVTLSWCANEITNLEVPASVQVLLGLILGEITKFIRENNLITQE